VAETAGFVVLPLRPTAQGENQKPGDQKRLVVYPRQPAPRLAIADG